MYDCTGVVSANLSQVHQRFYMTILAQVATTLSKCMQTLGFNLDGAAGTYKLLQADLKFSRPVSLDKAAMLWQLVAATAAFT